MRQIITLATIFLSSLLFSSQAQSISVCPDPLSVPNSLQKSSISSTSGSDSKKTKVTKGEASIQVIICDPGGGGGGGGGGSTVYAPSKPATFTGPSTDTNGVVKDSVAEVGSSSVTSGPPI